MSVFVKKLVAQVQVFIKRNILDTMKN